MDARLFFVALDFYASETGLQNESQPCAGLAEQQYCRRIRATLFTSVSMVWKDPFKRWSRKLSSRSDCCMQCRDRNARRHWGIHLTALFPLKQSGLQPVLTTCAATHGVCVVQESVPAGTRTEVHACVQLETHGDSVVFMCVPVSSVGIFFKNTKAIIM